MIGMFMSLHGLERGSTKGNDKDKRIVGGEWGVSFRNLLVFSSDLNIYEEYNLIINIPCVVDTVDNRMRYVIPPSLVPPRDNPRWSNNS